MKTVVGGSVILYWSAPMRFLLLNAFTTACKGAFLGILFLGLALFASGGEQGKAAIEHSSSSIPNGFAKVGSGFLFADLVKGDDRETVRKKLAKANFREIHEEKEKQLLRCALKLNGFRYDLACKFGQEGGLELCLVEGRKGWQFSFYDETLEPQWTNLRQILSSCYGTKRKSLPLPPLEKVPFGDPGGYVTDTWNLPDRIVVLTIQAFKVKDCCTNRFVDYSCCTLLVRLK